jgi:hypothetical protein
MDWSSLKVFNGKKTYKISQMCFFEKNRYEKIVPVGAWV